MNEDHARSLAYSLADTFTVACGMGRVMTDQPITAHHKLLCRYTEAPPSLSYLPITIDTGPWSITIARIKLSEDRIRVTRRFIGGWEEPYLSFLRLNCERISMEKSHYTNAYELRLVHPSWRKTIILYRFTDPRFHVSEFARELSDMLNLPLHQSTKFREAWWG
jgi:hypothetical protein